MSRRVVIVDDLDQTEPATPVRFGLDHKHYEIDLSEENAAKLREVLAPFVKASRDRGAAR